MMSVYSITHRASAREYIGITSGMPEVRWYTHTKRDSHIGRALRSYGRAAFQFRVEKQVATWFQACALECALIAERKPAFNRTAGGDGAFGCKKSPETIAKLRASLKGHTLGRKASPETLLKMAAAARGRKKTPEEIAKTAAANTGQKRSAASRAKIAAKAAGRKHTQATRDIIRAKRALQTNVRIHGFTLETRAKMRVAKLGKR